MIYEDHKGGGRKTAKKESIEGNKVNPNDSKQMSDDVHGQSKPNQPSKAEVPEPGPSASMKPITPNVPKQYLAQQPIKGVVSGPGPNFDKRKENQSMGSGGPKGKHQQQTRNTYSGKESAWSMPGPSSGRRPDASSEMVHRFGQQSLELAKVESGSKQLGFEESIQPKAVTTLKTGSSKVSGTRGKPLGQIETNYVEIFTENMVYDLVYQYDVKITAKREVQNREAPKKYRKQIFERFRERYFPEVCIAYDGSNIAYSPIKLNLSARIVRNVEYMDPETENKRQYLVDISETEGSDIPLKALKE